MIRDFIDIDFETANQHLCSICAMGVVIVRNGRVADEYYSLIHPEPEYYSYFCQRVHGLTSKDTDDAPIFPLAWEVVEKKRTALFSESMQVPFVAHNARFDEGCLKAVFRVYQMDYPDYFFYDTLAASRHCFGRTLENHQLQTVAAACGFDLKRHHHALADAEACARIALKIL